MNNPKFCFFTTAGRFNNERLIYQQAHCLQENKFDVYFLLSDKFKDAIIDGVQILSMNQKQGGYIYRFFVLPWKIYKRLLKIDAEVYQTYAINLLWICVLLKLKGKKVIFHLRESHPYTFYEKSNLPKLLKCVIVNILIFYMRFCLKKLDAIITVSNDILNYLKKWGIPHLYLIGNYPLINSNHNISFEDYCNRENRILYFGSIYKISCQREFLDALVHIDDIKYLLVGKFDNQNYFNSLKQHFFWSKVEFIDGFEYSELDAFFKKSTICNVLRDFSCTKSKNGSLGIIKLFESMEAGLPIICSDVPVYREMMKEYKCGILVNPKDKNQIKDAILYLVEHKKEAWEMGQNGRRAVIEKYSWDAQSKIYINIVENCLNKK